MPTTGRQRTKVFISYSHQDAKLLARLRVHLKPLEREHKIDIWDDTRIAAGARWRREIEEAMAEARVAILLVSADFMASDFIATEELPRLLAAAETEGAVIMPVILGPCLFEDDPVLSQFQTVNNPRKPLSSMTGSGREAVLVKIAKAVEAALSEPAGAAAPPTRDGEAAPVAPPAREAAGASARSVAAASSARSTPQSPGREAVQPVRVDYEGGGFAHGFFTPRGYVVTLAVAGAAPGKVVWSFGGGEHEAAVRVVRAEGHAALLKLEGVGRLPHPTPLGLSRSLQPGDAVERVLGPLDRAAGKVLSLTGEGEADDAPSDAGGPAPDEAPGAPSSPSPEGAGGHGVGAFLRTTRISYWGDAGAPVLDSAGRIVGMVVMKSQDDRQTLSLPIESIRLAFREAF